MHALTVIGCRNNVLRTSVHSVWMPFFCIENFFGIVLKEMDGVLLAYVYELAFFAVISVLSSLIMIWIW